MNQFVTGVIRTWVPIAVGAVISWLATRGMTVDADTQLGLITAATGLIQAGYYLAVRLVAEKFPWAGILLGSNHAPSYELE